MLKKILLTTTIATLAAPAFASGLTDAVTAKPVIAPAPVPVAPVRSQGADWSGFYLGGHAGTIVASEETFPSDVTAELQGDFFGLHGGYMYDLGRAVLGAELDYDLLNINEVSLSDGTDTTTTSVDVDGTITRLKLRAGYDAGRFLPYLAAGVAAINLDDDGIEADADGTFFGGGFAFAATDNILVGGEVLQHAFDTDADTEITTVSLRAAYKF